MKSPPLRGDDERGLALALRPADVLRRLDQQGIGVLPGDQVPKHPLFQRALDIGVRVPAGHGIGGHAVPMGIAEVGVRPRLHAGVDEDEVAASIRLFEDGVDTFVCPPGLPVCPGPPFLNRYSTSATGWRFPSISRVHTVTPFTSFRTMA